MKKIFSLLVVFLLSQGCYAIKYKGFVEAGYGFGVADYWGDAHAGKVSLFTTHGIDINRYLFVGAGAGVEVSTYNSVYFGMVVPIYADMRMKLSGKISPYFDLRIGDMIGAGDTGHALYIHPSVGYRFDIGKDKGIYIGVGYEGVLLPAHIDADSFFKGNEESLSLRIGFDF